MSVQSISRDRRYGPATIVASAIVAALVVPTVSQAAANPPAALVKTRAAFAAAVKARDVGAVEALTSFPLKAAVHGQPPSVSRSAFPKFLKDNGYVELTECLSSGPLAPSKTGKRVADVWRIECDGNIFYFALENGAWRHSEYENINE